MNATTQPRGTIAGSLVITLTVLGVAGLAFMYYTSNIWHTKIDTAITRYAEWTPENIANNPIGYLNYAEASTKAAIQQIKAVEIGTAQKRAKLEATIADVTEKITVGTEALAELKQSYKDAIENKQFPINWQDTTLDIEHTKRQIVALDRSIESSKRLLAQYNAAINQLSTQTDSIAVATDTATERIAQIDANREAVKLQGITADLKASLIAMKSILETPITGITTPTQGNLNLDDLVAKKHTSVDETEFTKILNK